MPAWTDKRINARKVHSRKMHRKVFIHSPMTYARNKLQVVAQHPSGRAPLQTYTEKAPLHHPSGKASKNTAPKMRPGKIPGSHDVPP